MPDGLARADRLQRQLDFICEIDQLKRVTRRTFLMDASRRENSAEHSWHLAMMALLLTEYSNEPVDAERVVRMVLVHDLVEIGAGDTYAYGGAHPEETRAREEQAARELFAMLPAEQGEALMKLWRDFDEERSAEARFARALDRLMPLLHNYFTRGISWREHGVTAEEVRRRMAPMREGSRTLWELAESIIDRAVQEGLLPDTSPGGATSG